MLKTCESNGYKVVIELGAEQTDRNGVGIGQFSGSIVESNLTKPDDTIRGDDELLEPGTPTFSGAMHGIESFILSLACAGVDIDTEAFSSAVFDAVEACANNLD